MEKLLEQEALLEQQDPKVRVPRPDLEAPGSKQERQAANQACPGPLPLPPRATWQLDICSFITLLIKDWNEAKTMFA